MPTILNQFKTVTAVLTTSNVSLYTPPTGYTGVILMAQIANITSTASPVNMSFYDGTSYTSLLQGYFVPGNDATSATVGKLVIEQGKSLYGQAGANSTLHVTLSILETFNG
jgi:hypothetical protein